MANGIVLAEGVVEVTADAKGVPRAIADDIEKGQVVTKEAGANIGKQVFGGVIGAWAAIGGTQIIGSFFTGAITGASGLNETMSKSSVIFGENAGKMEAWASTAATTVGLSKQAALDATAGFGDMFSQIGFTGDAAYVMSRQVVQAAADLGSFSNLETADVADRMAAAFRGEYDSLQQVIPNINAARVESEALAATGKKTASELTAQEKATAVLAIVQKDGARAMGDFARTSDGAANKQKIMTASLEDQQAKLGGLLLPAWSGFLGFLTSSVIPAFGSLIDWMGQNGETMLILGTTVAGAAVAYWAINSALAIHKAYTIASAAATGGLTVGQWALNAALSANPVGLIVLALAALVAGIVWVATQTTFFQDTWTNVTAVIGTAATWLWETVINPVFTAIGGVFTWIYDTIIMPIVTGIMIYIGLWAAIITWLWGAVISPVFAAIGAIFTWVYNTIILPVVNGISNGIRAAGAVVSWLWTSAVSPALNAVGAAFNWVWVTIISPVTSSISGAIRTIGSAVSTTFSTMGSFIGNAFQTALSAVKGPINGIIGLVNKAINGINSISVTIPAWVPIVGGQTWGASLPRIPMLARGSAYSPDTFIAGENGPELIVGRPGSRVYPNDQTRRMLGDDDAGSKTFHLEQKIYSSDPILAARQAAREAARYLGV